VEPVNRFLGALSVYLSQDQLISTRPGPGKSIQMQTETINSENGVSNVSITITGKGKHELKVKTFNSEPNFGTKQIDLSGNKTEKVDLTLKVVDMNKPYIAVIYLDKDPDIHEEIVGSYINASILSNK
jgi:hypothetical protein